MVPHDDGEYGVEAKEPGNPYIVNKIHVEYGPNVVVFLFLISLKQFALQQITHDSSFNGLFTIGAGTTNL